MSEQDYFANALANFTHEVASGGAIRHLADLGYTVRQITEQLSFPTPYEKVRKDVWEHLIDTRVVLLEEPGAEAKEVRGKSNYVLEYNQYGKASFRLVTAQEDEPKPIVWKERRFETGEMKKAAKAARAGGSRQLFSGKNRAFAAYLGEKCAENGEELSYCSCFFGLQRLKNPSDFQAAMEVFEERQREYVMGLPWEEKICYHRLDARMREIVVRLYENGWYEGACYFLKTEERVSVGERG
ncbi:hypothetical protein AALB53_08880 [Lachnospiraceae bacterium 47-T17]